jgi:hypothetical protein
MRCFRTATIRAHEGPAKNKQRTSQRVLCIWLPVVDCDWIFRGTDPGPPSLHFRVFSQKAKTPPPPAAWPYKGFASHVGSLLPKNRQPNPGLCSLRQGQGGASNTQVTQKKTRSSHRHLWLWLTWHAWRGLGTAPCGLRRRAESQGSRWSKGKRAGPRLVFYPDRRQIPSCCPNLLSSPRELCGAAHGCKHPKILNPRCFGIWGAIGKKVEAEKPNRVSAKCAIKARLSDYRLSGSWFLFPVRSVLYAVRSVLAGGHAVLPHGCD